MPWRLNEKRECYLLLQGVELKYFALEVGLVWELDLSNGSDELGVVVPVLMTL
jgi:hypothetical protein